MDIYTSIVILNYNTIDYIQTCVESIRAFTEKGRYEIIIVDNGSQDGSVEWLKSQADLKCIFNEKNEGFPKGCNQGMAIATGSEIMLLNSDVIVTPRWHAQMIKALYSSDDIGAVSCVTNCCSNFQSLSVPYTTMNIDKMLDFAEQYNHSNPALWTLHFTLVGFCFMFKRHIYDEIGTLDERFTPGNYEDDDYCFRIMKAGYKLILCRDTFIHHYGNGTFVKNSTPEAEREQAEKYNALLKRNFEYFRDKWQIRDIYYKNYAKSMSALGTYIKNNQRVLIVARNRLAYVCCLLSEGRNIEIDYLTDSRLDYELMHKHLNIIFSKKLIEGAKQLNGEYDGIFISDTVTDDAGMVDLKRMLHKRCSGIMIDAKRDDQSR
ncbi:glycosyltransferase family 2 protein [Anaerovibrio lipolyticus]|uniref:glycosyltransferase family 2 protein n=1 Tax=Anaerovibrio lipolyticus TaxID=82374 RepID=UPI0026F1BA22|nr:glycosyltransferase [Anaerovibrio lipolyticus]MBE6105123.1 glycosyltransferase [Anaerovibrio lipolyticus]